MTDRRRTDERADSDAASLDRFWASAERLIEEMEQTARQSIVMSETERQDFHKTLVSRLRQVTGADTVCLRIQQGESPITLADEGIIATSSFGPQIVAAATIGPQQTIELETRFANPIGESRQRAIEHLVNVLIELVVPVQLAAEVVQLRTRLHKQDQRDEFLTSLYRGANLPETLASIAATVSREAMIDRVIVLRHERGRFRALTSSSVAKIDRRANQIRLLERLADRSLDGASQFLFAIGTENQPEVTFQSDLDRYVDESGCRELYIESIRCNEQLQTTAAIVLERFRSPDDAPETLALAWSPIRIPVADAIGQAIHRDLSILPVVIDRIQSASGSRKLATCAILAGLVFAAAWVPVRFDLPVEGHVDARVQSRIYSPAFGVVSEVFVADGDHVIAGQTLVQLRSGELELKRQTLTTELETARAKLDSVSVLRSGQRESQSSSNEQVLIAEISGLQRQLESIKSQQDALTITSPIDGIVDQWAVAESLASRPVVHGQYLLSVIAPGDGWRAELAIPDQAVAYVLAAQSDQLVSCSIRLRSAPTEVFHGNIDRILGVADVNDSGQSMVRASVTIDDDRGQPLRQGATVIAEIDCGKRTAGFVYLRSLIEWYRCQTWI